LSLLLQIYRLFRHTDLIQTCHMQGWILEFRAQCKLSKRGLKTNCWGAHFGGFVHNFSVI